MQHARINRLRQADILIIADYQASMSHVDVDLPFLVSLRTP